MRKHLKGMYVKILNIFLFNREVAESFYKKNSFLSVYGAAFFSNTTYQVIQSLTVLILERWKVIYIKVHSPMPNKELPDGVETCL